MEFNHRSLKKLSLSGRGTGLYIADETQVAGCRLIYNSTVSLEFRGTQDVYHFDRDDGTLWVYRAKDRDLSGCVRVRNQMVYDQIYDLILTYDFSGMPENLFKRLEREWNQRNANR